MWCEKAAELQKSARNCMSEIAEAGGGCYRCFAACLLSNNSRGSGAADGAGGARRRKGGTETTGSGTRNGCGGTFRRYTSFGYQPQVTSGQKANGKNAKGRKKWGQYKFDLFISRVARADNDEDEEDASSTASSSLVCCSSSPRCRLLSDGCFGRGGGGECAGGAADSDEEQQDGGGGSNATNGHRVMPKTRQRRRPLRLALATNNYHSCFVSSAGEEEDDEEIEAEERGLIGAKNSQKTAEEAAEGCDQHQHNEQEWMPSTPVDVGGVDRRHRGDRRVRSGGTRSVIVFPGHRFFEHLTTGRTRIRSSGASCSGESVDLLLGTSRIGPSSTPESKKPTPSTLQRDGGLRYAMLHEGQVLLCRVDRTCREITSRLRHGQLFRKWESHCLALQPDQLASKTVSVR